MKTLIVYDYNGNIIFTQTNATETYNCLVEDIAEGKIPVSVDISTGKCILDDNEKVKKEKQKLKEELEKKQNEITNTNKELLKQQADLVDFTYKNLI
nr:MAG TPA: triphosphate pyrophosphohydrolase [Caudoviricetes sp.]